VKLKEALTYDDVLLVPQYSEIASRSQIELTSFLGDIPRPTPILASPMDTVSELDMAIAMKREGGTAIIHRYCSIEEQCKMVEIAARPVGAAIGATDDYFKRARDVAKAGASFLCIDVAHGHHIFVKEAIQRLRGWFGQTIHIMAGNVATLEGFNDLADWGADSIRCNIGGGSICSTRIQTGHGMPGLETIFQCAKSDRNVSIIADGGIRSSGDIVKALAAGADFVMLGSLLAGTDEAPGNKIERDGRFWKEYRGMASEDAQMDWRGASSTPEGISSIVPYVGTVGLVMEDLKGGIRSGLSYSGASNIAELQAKAKFVRQTAAGAIESNTHILLRSK